MLRRGTVGVVRLWALALCSVALLALAPRRATSQRALGGTASLVSIRENLAYHVVRLAQWPNAAFAAKDAPILITVVEPPRGAGMADLFRARASYLDAHAESRPHGRSYVVRHTPRADGTGSSRLSLSDAHVVYVAEAAGDDLAAVLDAVRGRPILTIGESQEFVKVGGMVALVVEQGRLRPWVDLEVVRAAGLRMGAELLRHARIVRGGEKGL